MYRNYSRVRLISSRFESEGLAAGSYGFIIEVWDEDDYEVEFSDGNGITLAQITANEDELEIADPPR